LTLNISQTARPTHTPESLYKANRKPHPCFQMAPASMTLSDLLARFQGHGIIQRQVTRKLYKIGL